MNFATCSRDVEGSGLFTFGWLHNMVFTAGVFGSTRNKILLRAVQYFHVFSYYFLYISAFFFRLLKMISHKEPGEREERQSRKWERVATTVLGWSARVTGRLHASYALGETERVRDSFSRFVCHGLPYSPYASLLALKMHIIISHPVFYYHLPSTFLGRFLRNWGLEDISLKPCTICTFR